MQLKSRTANNTSNGFDVFTPDKKHFSISTVNAVYNQIRNRAEQNSRTLHNVTFVARDPCLPKKMKEKTLDGAEVFCVIDVIDALEHNPSALEPNYYC